MIASMTLSELCGPLEGEIRGGDASFSRVSTDTRRLQRDDLYVALRGDNFDGNDFVDTAVESGACGAIVEQFVDVELPQLRVSNPRKALGILGALNRQRSAAKVIALTGSQGKTTVKEMTGRIMSRHNPVLVTRGNLNNEVGVPLMLLELEAEHAFAVFELGANAAGEIAWTVQLVKPDIALINNAAATHLEGFGSLSGVVEAKGEIIDGVSENGTVVLNQDDPAWLEWVKRAGTRRLVSFSLNTKTSAEYCATKVDARGSSSRFSLNTPQGEVDITLPLPGMHNIANALAACALCMESGIPLGDIKAGLESMSAVPGRLDVGVGIAGSLLIDDSYNASPSSFRAGIDVLVGLSEEKRRKAVLIAGDMGELGEQAPELHRDMGRYAADAGVAELWVCGRFAGDTASGFSGHAHCFESREAIARHAAEHIGENTVVLIKGSRSAGMHYVVNELKCGDAV